MRPIDIGGLWADPGQLGAIEAQVLARLEELSEAHPGVLDDGRKRRHAAAELTHHLVPLRGAAPAMDRLVRCMRSVQIRGLGQLNFLWPRMFVVETTSTPVPIDILGATTSELGGALRSLLNGYVANGTAALNWAIAAVLATRPATLAALHATLASQDAAFPDFDAFRRAWAPYFSFANAQNAARQPDWQYYWERERQTAYGPRYPASIIRFLSTFLTDLRERLPTAKLLDVGTGNHAATHLARQLGPLLDLYGIDLAPATVAGPSGIRLARMTADRLGLASATFQAAISVNGIEYATPESALPELRRVLEPDALVALVLHRPDSVVVRRATRMNAFLRGARLLEAVALVSTYLGDRDERLRAQLEAHVASIERERDRIPPDEFFARLWPVLRDALRALPHARDDAVRAVTWCEGFLRWVLSKNDYVCSHAARLGASADTLAATLRTHGFTPVKLLTLDSDIPGDPGVAAWGVIARA